MDISNWVTAGFTLAFLAMALIICWGSYKLLQKRLAEDEKQTDILRGIARRVGMEVREEISQEIDEGWVDDLVKMLRSRAKQQVEDHITREVRSSIERMLKKNDPES